MLTNPYKNPITLLDETGINLQCAIEPKDKALLISLRPVKGTIQLIVNNLLFNLCNDLRECGIENFRVDGDEILDIFTSPRPLSLEQCERIRRTSACATSGISERFFNDRRGSEVRQETPADQASSNHLESVSPRRVKRNSKKVSKEEKGTDETANRS